MVRAYVLIEMTAGRANELVRILSQQDGVREACRITGPYDVIAEIQADSVESIVGFVESRIHTAPGVVRTMTCACMS